MRFGFSVMNSHVSVSYYKLLNSSAFHTNIIWFQSVHIGVSASKILIMDKNSRNGYVIFLEGTMLYGLYKCHELYCLVLLGIPIGYVLQSLLWCNLASLPPPNGKGCDFITFFSVDLFVWLLATLWTNAWTHFRAVVRVAPTWNMDHSGAF